MTTQPSRFTAPDPNAPAKSGDTTQAASAVAENLAYHRKSFTSQTAETEKPESKIAGHCEVEIPGDVSPSKPACRSALLILRNERGEEVANTRPDGSGSFQFAPLPAGKYSIVLAQPHWKYELAPKGALSTGSQVQLQLFPAAK